MGVDERVVDEGVRDGWGYDTGMELKMGRGKG